MLLAAVLLAAGLGMAFGVEEQPSGEALREATTPAPQERFHFDVWEFRVDGNTLLDTMDVERAVYSHLGPQKTIEDIEAARAALESLYRTRGYGTVLVNIPEQDVSNAVVRLEVIEGKIDRLRITGNKYFSQGKIREKVPALAPGEIPHLPTAQKQLAKLNQASPDRAVTPIFRAGREPGSVEAELKVKDELPLHGSIELNNRYTQNTTKPRLSGSLRYDNLWQRQHSLSLSYLSSPENREEVKVLSGTYLFPLGDSGKQVVLYGVKSASDVASLGTLGVIGKGNIFGVRGIVPLRGSEGMFHSLSTGLDYKDLEDVVRLDGAGDLATPIDYLKLSAEYRATFLGSSGTTRGSAGVHFAPRGVINSEEEFESKRFKAEPNFIYLTGSLEREQRLPKQFSLMGRMEWQVADGPLVSSEQFCAGGVETVRGYVECEELGDHGLAATVELRSPALASYIGEPLNRLMLLAFLDRGYVHVEDPLPGEDREADLMGTGLGMRITAWSGLKGELDWAYPLLDASATAAGGPRWHFRLGYEF
jgi:hemolysin activation/secretion protein